MLAMQPHDPVAGLCRLNEEAHVVHAPVVSEHAVQFAGQFTHDPLAAKYWDAVHPQ